MMDVPCLHVGHIKDVRDRHITRITKDKVRDEGQGSHALDHIGSRKQMRGSNVAWPERVQPRPGLCGGTLASAFPLVFRVKRMQAARERCNLRESKQDLVEQVRAA